MGGENTIRNPPEAAVSSGQVSHWLAGVGSSCRAVALHLIKIYYNDENQCFVSLCCIFSGGAGGE